MSDELKPCPFCGGPANESTERVGISTWLTFVKCWSCAFDMQMSKWNRRPIEDALRAELEALRKWEVRVVRSMDEASAAAGVEYCDAVPKAIQTLHAEIAALKNKLAFYEECAEAPLMKTVMDERDRLREVVKAADAMREELIPAAHPDDNECPSENCCDPCWSIIDYDAARAKVTL